MKSAFNPSLGNIKRNFYTRRRGPQRKSKGMFHERGSRSMSTPPGGLGGRLILVT